MSPAHKANDSKDDAYRKNHEKIFREKKKKKITKKEIKKFQKEYAENHTFIGTDKPVHIDDRMAELLIKVKRRHEEWLNSIHPSHDMNEWHGEVRAPVGTARMYSVRQCKKCEYEQSQHPAGKFMDGELNSQCEGEET